MASDTDRNSPTTILITANTSWNLFNFRRNLITALLDSGYRVIAVAPKDQHSEWLQQHVDKFIHISIQQHGTNPYHDYRLYRDFLKIFKQESPQLILSFTPKNNIYGSLAARKLGLPIINNVAGLGAAFTRSGLIRTIVTRLYRKALADMPLIFFQNSDDISLFNSLGICTINQAQLLPGSGVDLCRFKPGQADSDGKLRFLFSGRLLYSKGIRLYLEAAVQLKKLYPEVEFHVIGFTDPENPNCIKKQELEAYSTNKLVEVLPGTDELEHLLARYACMVLPSWYREGTPRTLLEAAASGLAIITTDTPGCRDVVDAGQNGFLCETHKLESLMDTMERFIQLSATRRTSMGACSRRIAEQRFDEKVVLQRYLVAIKGALLTQD